MEPYDVVAVPLPLLLTDAGTVAAQENDQLVEAVPAPFDARRKAKGGSSSRRRPAGGGGAARKDAAWSTR